MADDDAVRVITRSMQMEVGLRLYRERRLGGPAIGHYQPSIMKEFADRTNGPFIVFDMEDDMADVKWGDVLNAAIRIAPIAFEWVAENVMKIGKGTMTPQEVREALSPIADSPERAERIDAILNSEDLADAYQRASDVLDTE